MDNSVALKAIANHRLRKERVVFTNGCFDILHVGHVRFLEQARSLGDVLVVGLNSDSSIKHLKGTSRPILPQNERSEILRALRSVDYVILFEQDTPFDLIAELKPDVLVKGGDYAISQIVGADLVTSYGGSVRSLPFYQGHSTTELVKRISTLS